MDLSNLEYVKDVWNWLRNLSLLPRFLFMFVISVIVLSLALEKWIKFWRSMSLRRVAFLAVISAVLAIVLAFVVAREDGRVTDLGVNLETGRREIRVNLDGLPPGSKPLEMTLIPEGEFEMGAPREEEGRYEWDELPHTVTIPESFFMAKYETTQAQWEAVMGTNPSEDSEEAKRHGVFSIGPNCPVYYVSWDDCQEFIKRLNGLGFGTFRLPSEAEWEYACRAGTKTPFYWEYKKTDDYSRYKQNSQPRDNKVGTKLPNNWGLYDTSGNAWEWCQDQWTDPEPDVRTSTSRRVFRGGDYSCEPDALRSAARKAQERNYRSPAGGFRLVRQNG